ncbi:MAG TPA: type II toxin-antitoxin system RelE/ParE family toxin [Phycisphaerae bacterium]|nr:type II toxin-antitoxin system RelE/ParE family toxin [Phycisphaerae bacterium]
MGESYRVILTAEAVSNLEEIATYIERTSPQNAAEVAAAVVKAIDSLATMPARFPVVGRTRRRSSTLHAMVVYPFVVYYRVDAAAGVVYVLYLRRGTRRSPRGFRR